MSKPFCCFIDPDTKVQCTADPTHQVEGEGPYQETQACPAHALFMVPDCGSFVTPLDPAWAERAGASS